MENVLDIVYNYSINKKLLDKNISLLIIQQLINEYNINNIEEVYTNRKSFKNLLSNVLGTFSGKKINIFINKIHSYIKRKKFQNDFVDELSYYLRYNLIILYTIIHELEHAIEEMKIKENKDDIETKLLRIEKEYITQIELGSVLDDYYGSSIPNFNYKKELKNYYKNSSISFYERMAEIHAYDKILEIIKPVKDKIIELYKYQEILFLKSKLFSFKGPNDSPTIRFFSNIGKLSNLNDIDYSSLNVDDRLTYGFSLSNEEYNSIKEKIRSI